MGKCRIALITMHRLYGIVGGAERVLCDMANALVNKGYIVTILCCEEKGGRPFYELNRGIEVKNFFNGIPFFSRQILRNLRSFDFDRKKKYTKRKKIECQWKAKSLKELVDLDDFDLFIAFDFESAYVLKDLLKEESPIIVMSHAEPSAGITSQKYDILNNAVNRCAVLQVLMPQFIDECRTVLPDVPIVYIPNVAPQYKESSALTSKTIVCVSRYEPISKRPALLVDAFALISHKHLDWTVKFWGRFNGKKTEDIRSLVKQRNLDERFELCGFTQNIKKELLNGSIFVLPSAHEAFSLALVEAMAVGLPVVGCSDCSSVSTLIQHGHNGLLAEPNAKALAEALETLISSFELRCKLGKQAKIDIIKFSADEVWMQWDNLINRVLKGQI